MRAITLKVDETMSVAGFVQPGHHVDIVTTIENNDLQEGANSKVILQNIRVIASGHEIERKDDEKPKIVPTVTVLVNLEQAERLSLAANVGSIRLVLRNHADKDEEMTTGAKMSSLIFQEPKSFLPPPQLVEIPEEEPEVIEEPINNVHTVIIHRGNSQTEVSFRD